MVVTDLEEESSMMAFFYRFRDNVIRRFRNSGFQIETTPHFYGDKRS